MGNLKSVQNVLKHLRVDGNITDNYSKIIDSDGVILPGVGAFGDAMNILKEKNLINTINIATSSKTWLTLTTFFRIIFIL